VGRIIWTILGGILAVWLAFMAVGWIFAMVKTFFIVGLIAAAVFLVVRLLAKRPRRG
jgi:flagellar biogenesis protein FliO